MSQPDEHELAKQRRDLVKRRQEVEERERAVDEREARLDTGQHETQQELRILEGRVSAKQTELAMTTADIERKVQQEAELVADANRKAAIAKHEAEALQKLASDQRQALDQINDAVKAAKKAQKQVNAELAERKQYLADQEALIEQTIRDGNTAINTANRQLGELESQKEHILGQLHDFEVQMNRLTDTLADQEEKLGELRQRYELAAVKYRTDLINMRDELKQLEEKKAVMDRDSEAKLADIQVKQKELDIQRDVINKLSEQVAADKRQVESKKALYGLL